MPGQFTSTAVVRKPVARSRNELCCDKLRQSFPNQQCGDLVLTNGCHPSNGPQPAGLQQSPVVGDIDGLERRDIQLSRDVRHASEPAVARSAIRSELYVVEGP